MLHPDCPTTLSWELLVGAGLLAVDDGVLLVVVVLVVGDDARLVAGDGVMRGVGDGVVVGDGVMRGVGDGARLVVDNGVVAGDGVLRVVGDGRCNLSATVKIKNRMGRRINPCRYRLAFLLTREGR